MIVRLLGVVLALSLFATGGFGIAAPRVPDHPLVGGFRGVLGASASLWTSATSRDLTAESLEKALSGPLLGWVLGGLGLLILAAALWPRRRVASDGDEGAMAEPHAVLDPRLARRAEKQAAAMAKKGRLAEAADFLFQSGLLDPAAEYFERAGDLVRAAEVRHDQNRFEESADLYLRAGQHETAGTIFASQNQFARAAECYVKAGRLSVAAEMYEKDGADRRAGECYAQCGFQRHAAQAFLKAQDWSKAASALEAVILEEGVGTGTGQAPGKEEELRKLVLQAGKLYEQAGDLEAAERVLEKGRCWSAAGEIAFQLGHDSKAADLFVHAGDPRRAAEALRRLGEDKAAHRILGEFHRDRGEDEEAARHLVEAGEYLAAGDLYRKLEAYEDAGECYEREGDSHQAAEMFRLVGNHGRAATNYEHAGQFDEAAEACELAGDRVRQAAFLARAGRHVRAGEAYRSQGLDDEAIKVLQQVDSASSDFGAASALLGEIFDAKGQHTLAITKLTQAIGGVELGRENLDAYYRLATVHEADGDAASARKLYEKILAFDYHHADVADRLAALGDRALGSTSESATQSRPGSSPTSPRVGDGRYRILGELGRGGMGIVYKAHDTVLDRPVAFKVLPDALRENPQALKNFLREAKSAAKLNHPNIVTVYDAGEQDGRYYIAMEYVDGTTLKEILRRRKVISANGVFNVLLQMCEALGYAHHQKVVHRDVKTANTMWTRDKKAKVMDFGLAKVVEEVRNHTTLVSGTPYYMSPEQTLGRNVDHRTDLYSLGVTLFELSTGALPFREGNVPYHHVHTPPPDPRTVNPQMPAVLAHVISKCLRKDPEERYGDAREIIAEIKGAFARSDGATNSSPAS